MCIGWISAAMSSACTISMAIVVFIAIILCVPFRWDHLYVWVFHVSQYPHSSKCGIKISRSWVQASFRILTNLLLFLMKFSSHIEQSCAFVYTIHAGLCPQTYYIYLLFFLEFDRIITTRKEEKSACGCCCLNTSSIWHSVHSMRILWLFGKTIGRCIGHFHFSMLILLFRLCLRVSVLQKPMQLK